jgi:broad specificity phosphatase PhoE
VTPAGTRSTAERTVVHLLRHGEVDNPAGVLYGRLPGYHLSERGRKMAEVAAAHLADRDIRAVIASPLERAQETATPLATALNLDIGTDERIIEAANTFEGQVFGADLSGLRHPAVWWRLRNPFRPSWGEPYRQLAARMLAAAEDARDQVRGHEVVLVSHQLPIWIARLAAERRRLWHDPRRRECALASLTSLEYEGDDLVNLTYAEPAAALLPGANPAVGA